VSRLLLLACALLAALLLAGSVRAQQQVDTSQRDALEREIEEYEQLRAARNRDIASIEEELGSTATVLQRRVAERDAVSRELAELRAERARLQAEIARLGEDLEQTEAEIGGIVANLESLQERISALLVNLFTQRSGRYAQTLTKAASYHDLQVRSHYLALLTRQDVSLIEQLDQARIQLLAAQETLAQQLAQQAAREEELRGTEASLTGKQQELAGIISELESTQAGQQVQRQALLQAQGEIEAALGDLGSKLSSEIRRLREEEERLQREAAQAFLEQRELEREKLLQRADETRARIENLTAPLLPASTDYSLPLASPSVVSRYGEENNSYLALRATAANAAVMSVEAGVVIAVSVISANDGYHVSVQHSNELATSYTNLQAPLVRVGDRVTRGQVLGYLGGGNLVPPDVLKLWVVVTQNGRTSFSDPQARLGY
jgi:septal ring factor EnvC (AmiA/AmiB activator)